MQIQVTHADIVGGRRHSSYGCPVALAIRRALPSLSEVEVGAHTITLKSPSSVQSLLVPQIEWFVKRFDKGLPWPLVRPFIFDLNVADRLIAV